MANREMVWQILADFSSLTTQAKQAANAVNSLDRARNKANSNATKPIVSDKDNSNLAKLTALLQANTQARRLDNTALQASTRAHKDNIAATTRATAARKGDERSLNSHASAARNHAHNLGVATSGTKNHTAALRNNSRASREARVATRELSGSMGHVQKLFDRTGQSSRSFSLIMKMLPLTAVTSAFNSLAPAIAGVGGALVGLAGTIGPVMGLLGAMPTMLTAVAGSIGGVVAGVSGIGGAFGKWRKAQQATDKATNKSVGSTAKSEKSRQRSIRNTTRSIEKAKQDQVRNAEEIVEAQQHIADTARDNARSIRDAEKNVASALNGAKRAHLEVTAARREAAQAIEDYRDKLKGMGHDEESAVMELERARGDLARAMADPGATDLERRSADLAVRQAELRVSEVRKSNLALQKEAADTTKKGVEGSDIVVAAKEAEIEANGEAADAQESLKRAREDADKAMKSAQKGLISANEAYADGAQRIQDLQEDLADLKDTSDEAAGSASAAATATNEYNAALAKLGPNARAVVKELIKYVDAWDAIAKRAQEAIAPGLLSFLQDLRIKLLPDIADFLVRMAGGAGAFAQSLGKLLTKQSSIEAFREIFSDSYDFMSLMGESVLNITEWLLGLGKAAKRSGLTKWIGTLVRDWTAAWKEMVTTPEGLEGTIQGFKDAQKYATLWGEAIKGTWKFLRSFFKAFRPMGEWVLENITETTNQWNEWVKSDDGQDKVKTWTDLAKVNLSGLTKAIGTIVKQGPKLFDGIDFQKVWDALNGDGAQNKGLINALGDLLGIVDERMIVNIVNLGTSIADVLKSIGDAGAMNGVIALVDLLGGLADIVATLINKVPILGNVIAVAIAGLSLKKLAEGFGALTGIKDVTDAMGRAKVKGYSKGDGLYSAATKEYLQYGAWVPDRNTEGGANAYANSRAGRKASAAQSRQASAERINSYKSAPNYGISVGPTAGPLYSATRKGELAVGGKEVSSVGLSKSQMKQVSESTSALGRLSSAGKGVSGAFRVATGAIAGFLGPVGLIAGAVSLAGAGLSFLQQKSEDSKMSLEDMGTVLERVGTNSKAWDDIFSPEGLGPVNIFGQLSSAINDTEDAMKGLKEASDALPLTENMFTIEEDVFSEQAQRAVEALGRIDTASQEVDFSTSRTAIADLTTKMQESGVSSDFMVKKLPENAKVAENALKKLRDEGSNVEINSKNIADIMTGKLPEGLLATTEGYMTSAEAMKKQARVLEGEVSGGYYKTQEGVVVLADSQEALEDKTKLATAEQEKQRAEMDKSLSKWKSAKDAVDALNQAQREGANRFMSAEEAQAKYNETLGQAKSILEENKNALNDTKDGFNLTTEAGRNTSEYFRTLATTARDNTDAMLKNGESINVVNARMQQQRDSLIKTLGDFGITGEAAQAYADRLGLIPNYTATQIMLENVDLSKEQIDEIETKMFAFPDSVKSEIRTKAISDGYDAAMEMINTIPKDVPVRIGIEVIDVGEGTVVKYGGATGYTGRYGRKKAQGGPIYGPGTETSDSIPALLSNNEYVIKAKSARSVGFRTLDHINKRGELPQFAGGGKVGSPTFSDPNAKLVRTSSSSSVLAKVTSILDETVAAFSNLGNYFNQWGQNFGNWWTSLWTNINSVGLAQSISLTRSLTTQWNILSLSWARLVASMLSQVTGPWTIMWMRAQVIAQTNLQRMRSTVETYAVRMVTAVASTTPAMHAAWTGFMGAMQGPIKNGVKFINETLGTLVNKVGSYYGVKGSPFPVHVAGFDQGGWTGRGSRLQPAGIVHADEYVIKKSSRQRIEKTAPGLLDHMNRTGNAPGYARGGRVMPTNGRENPNTYSGHSGIDYMVPIGTPVRAADSGIITSTPRLNRSYGWHIVEALAGGLRAVYAHLSGFTVRPGQAVQAGQVIGRSGSTGNSTGPHLHLEVTNGSFGSASNRSLTRSWLSGAQSAPGGAVAALAQAATALSSKVSDDAIASSQGALESFSKANSDTGWGQVVVGAIRSLAGAVTGKIKSSVSAAISASGVSTDDDGSSHGALVGIDATQGDRSLTKYKGGTFSRKFAAVLMAAERMAGVGFNITQGGFRPRTAASGTSHAGDAVDIGSPVTSRVVNALRRNGVAAWDRTGKGNWGSHIHGVPLPGYGFGAGSAPWQAQDYLRGGDGLGSRGRAGKNLRKMYASGGWTGPGSRLTPAGVVHADEFVIKKNSRKKIERQAPGLLNHLNDTGTMEGYAKGGRVAAPRTQANFNPHLRNYTVYLSYLKKAQEHDARVTPRNTLPETRNHTRILETLLYWEGLLGTRAIDGHFGVGEANAIKSLQKSYGIAQTGKIDYDTYRRLLGKYKVKYNSVYNYSPGYEQPTFAQSVTSKQVQDNKISDEFYGYLSRLKANGFTKTFEKLKSLGATGIPEEYRDSIAALTGMQLAKELANNIGNARAYEQSLRNAAKNDGTDRMATKMDELFYLLAYGPHSPYGLQSAAKEIGVSMDTAAVLFKKILANGSLKNVSPTRTNRIRGDLASFDNLFKFNKGGVVPGTGNTDSVLAWLTPGELVVPKDVVQGMFPTQTPKTFNEVSSASARRTDTTSSNAGRVIEFNTNVYNPVAEESSVSVQKRVKSMADLGLLGRG